MEKYAELNVAPSGRPAAISTTPVVPLLWPALFSYEECQVRRDGTLEVFSARASVADALSRIREIGRVCPGQAPMVAEAARRLTRALRACDGEAVELFPVKIFSELQRDQQPVHLQRMVNLADLWGRLRAGEPWEQISRQLTWVDPAAEQLLVETDEAAALAGFVGQPAASLVDPQDVQVREGQGKEDVAPEALAAGEHGLLLGRFDGRWKLMSSGTDQHLRAVWGAEGGAAFAVGVAGAAVRIHEGRCKLTEVPTTSDLRAVWGSSSGSVVAVGDGGTVLVFTGRRWQPWSVPTEADLRTVAGTGPEDIYIAGQRELLTYDGVNWSSQRLPEESQIVQLCSVNGVIFGASNSPYGGEVFSLTGRSIKQHKQLPAVERLAGIWRGWGAGMGALASPGQVLLSDGAGWTAEAVPADEVLAVAAGACLLAVGRVGEHSVILARKEDGWTMEASVPRALRLSAAWAAGDPKPPRLSGGG